MGKNEILLIKCFLRNCHICFCYFKKENVITFMMIYNLFKYFVIFVVPWPKK